jgi:hypothetical protein
MGETLDLGRRRTSGGAAPAAVRPPRGIFGKMKVGGAHV